ncbi:hypothetical protein EC24168_1493 [Escherichia coli 2.4168]|nr:hypothetical protein EC24168_1493 [Escherichia coli 2.4168]
MVIACHKDISHNINTFGNALGIKFRHQGHPYSKRGKMNNAKIAAKREVFNSNG